MPLTRIDIGHIRCFDRVSLTGLGKTTCFIGNNGAGKTSLLEAIHLLTVAKSFRTADSRSLITNHQPLCQVFGQIQQGEHRSHRIGVQRDRSNKASIRVDGEALDRIVSLVSLQPVCVISDETLDLIDGSPQLRRQFVDWGVFHVEHSYAHTWAEFQRIVRQRNALLRSGGTLARGQIAHWDKQLAGAGVVVDEARRRYCEQFAQSFADILETLLQSRLVIRLDYRAGWPKEYANYADALAAGIESDLAQGFTGYGPHRADVRIAVEGLGKAAAVLSRGQKKITALALRLAQIRQLDQLHHDRGCILLVDDLAAELDEEHQRRVIRLVEGVDSLQAFYTYLDADWARRLHGHQPGLSMFHVEHGKVERIESTFGAAAGSIDIV
jgi:DNA replication and repair protein RecF